MSTLQLVAVGVYCSLFFLYAVVAQVSWSYRRARRPPSHFFVVFPLFATFVATYYFVAMLVELMPARLAVPVTWLALVCSVVLNVSLVAIGALYRHMLPLIPVHEDQPSRWWLAGNYGIAAAVAVLTALPLALPEHLAARASVAASRAALLFFFVMLVVGTVQAMRRRPQLIRPTRPTRQRYRRALDRVWLLLLICAAGIWLIGRADAAILLSRGGLGLLAAASFTRWGLERILERFLLLATMMAGTMLVYFGVRTVVPAAERFGVDRVVEVLAALALVLAFVGSQSLLRRAIDRIVFGSGRHREQELQVALRLLSPELGILGCCQRAVTEVARIMQLPSAAILLRHQDGVAIHGDFGLEPLRRVWPLGEAADHLPPRTFGVPEVRDLALKEALVAADVITVVSVVSPRQRWGHLFIPAGILATAIADEYVVALDAFADKLALILDGAELLARAVAVERSFAQAEKLAAIGETAARIAHEIRNPVTAARSLAQQLAREPASEETGELTALILAELERVERQVASLLRFARREEYRFESVDLGALVRTTVDEFRSRLASAEIEATTSIADGLMARVDREKMRQVLVNLLENAIDALSDIDGARRLALAVVGNNGSAMVQVSDTGCGAPAAALPKIFEPFFSLKDKGTGLGLAIVKRTVEAHGGRITAQSAVEGGMTFQFELPLAGTE